MSASFAANAWLTRARACPTSLPAAAFWSFGTERRLAFSRASGECSAVCSARTTFRAAESAASAIAVSAACDGGLDRGFGDFSGFGHGTQV